MSVHAISVDLLNPGQVFACIGFAELADLLTGSARGGFDWADENEPHFALSCAGDSDPFSLALDFLLEAEVRSLAPHSAEIGTERWSVETQHLAEAEPFPIPLPSSPATLPASLSARGKSIRLDSWGEGTIPDKLTARRDNVKFWAGTGGYPGAALLRDAIELVRSANVDLRKAPFEVTAAQSSSFRFDWRRDYIPIDIGFSINAHGKMVPRGYPLVEILALIGLCHARPARVNKLEYRYFVTGYGNGRPLEEEHALLPMPLLRASLGTSNLPFPTRAFRMRLDWPGQENQARCITTVDEETIG